MLRESVERSHTFKHTENYLEHRITFTYIIDILTGN